MHRGSPSPGDSPNFDPPDFPAFRRVKPLPKRRRTLATSVDTGMPLGFGSGMASGVTIAEENLSAAVTAIFDEHNRQRQRQLGGRGATPTLPPSLLPVAGFSSKTSPIASSLYNFNSALANATIDSTLANPELEEVLLAHAESLSTRMALQNYYTPLLGGVRGFLSAAAAAASSVHPNNDLNDVDSLDRRSILLPLSDSNNVAAAADEPLPEPPPPLPPMASRFINPGDLNAGLDLNLDIDLDSLNEFGARFEAAAEQALEAVGGLNLEHGRLNPNGKGRPKGNRSRPRSSSESFARPPLGTDREREGDNDDFRDENASRAHHVGQGNTKKRKVPTEGALTDRDRDRDRESGDEEEDPSVIDDQERQEIHNDDNDKPSSLRFNQHSQQQSQYHHSNRSDDFLYAPAPYPGQVARVLKRRGKLTAAALAGVQQKEMLRRRRRQLAAFMNGLAASGEGAGMNRNWPGGKGPAGSIENVDQEERPPDAFGFGMSMVVEQALMQMQAGAAAAVGGDGGTVGNSGAFGFWSTSGRLSTPTSIPGPVGEGGGIFANPGAIGLDMEAESQFLFESVTGFGLAGGFRGSVPPPMQGESVMMDFHGVANLAGAIPHHRYQNFLNSLNSLSSASSPNSTTPFPLPVQQSPPVVRRSKRRTVRLARAMKIILETPEKRTPHPDAVAFPKKEVFEFRYHSGTSDRLSATKEEVNALRRRFETELEKQKKKAKRMALVAAAAAAGNTGVGTGGQTPFISNEKDVQGPEKSLGSTKSKKQRNKENVPHANTGTNANVSSNKSTGSTKSKTGGTVTPDNPVVAGSPGGVNGVDAGGSPTTAPGKGKKKKKKRSALANASNPHHLRNYVPSRLPTGGSGAAPGIGVSQDYWGISPLPLKFLSSDIPPRKKGRDKSNLGISRDKENQLPNPHPPEEEWICAFCEYDLFYGGQAGYNRAVKARKKVLKRRRRARERAVGLGTAKSKPATDVAPATSNNEHEEEESVDEGSEAEVEVGTVHGQTQSTEFKVGRLKEDG